MVLYGMCDLALPGIGRSVVVEPVVLLALVLAWGFRTRFGFSILYARQDPSTTPSVELQKLKRKHFLFGVQHLSEKTRKARGSNPKPTVSRVD